MKKLQNNRGYIESLGNQDKAGFFRAMQEEGEGTVIRACLWRN